MDFLNIDHAAIEQFCYNKLSSNDNRIAANQVWITLGESCNELKLLFDQVQLGFDQAHAALNLSNKYKQEIKEGWCTINNCYATSKPHTHPGAFFSAVYYPKVSINSGNIEFLTPNSSLQHTLSAELVTDYNEFTSSTFHVEPATGALLIFPASLIHYVNTGLNNEDRISIAINSHIIKK
jgi:uncharacterized protein (TIGR02466 family)